MAAFLRAIGTGYDPAGPHIRRKEVRRKEVRVK